MTACVGALVGIVVGVVVGAADGSAVGEEDGFVVGEIVGLVVGAAVASIGVYPARPAVEVESSVQVSMNVIAPPVELGLTANGLALPATHAIVIVSLIVFAVRANDSRVAESGC